MAGIDVLIWLLVGIASLVFIMMLIVTTVFVFVFGVLVLVLCVGSVAFFFKIRSEHRSFIGVVDDEDVDGFDAPDHLDPNEDPA